MYMLSDTHPAVNEVEYYVEVNVAVNLNSDLTTAFRESTEQRHESQNGTDYVHLVTKNKKVGPEATKSETYICNVSDTQCRGRFF